jgi:5-methylcytosine-specific restriction endonuclease McrA
MDMNALASTYRLDDVSDEVLHARVRRLVGRSNQLLAALLAHLAEVEGRGIHRERACASLATYCQYELRMSEDAAFRRAQAARIARRFPVVFEHIAAGELHLTGLLLLGPHLTDQNHRELLACAKHRSKKEIVRLVRSVSPLPAVPAVVEPLGPAPVGIAPVSPTWSQLVSSMCPIRELSPGDRPKDWLVEDAARDCFEAPPAEPATDSSPTDLHEAVHATQRYKVQFTATQEYIDLLEEATDLLAHAMPSRSLEDVHLRAMRLFVTQLKKRKYAISTSHAGKDGASAKSREPREPREPRGRTTPRRRGRYVRAAERRAVYERDGGRCTYIDASGRRCSETRWLELDHIEPHACGGSATAQNLRLRCRAHNALAAEQHFGREFMSEFRGTLRASAEPP